MIRRTARAILVNQKSDEILLIKYYDKISPLPKTKPEVFWAFPGGGLKKGESFEDALIRELDKELGIRDAEINSCVGERSKRLSISGGMEKEYYERYYIVETSTFEINPINLSKREERTICEFKWWSMEEIVNTDEVILPASLKEKIMSVRNNLENIIDLNN